MRTYKFTIDSSNWVNNAIQLSLNSTGFSALITGREKKGPPTVFDVDVSVRTDRASLEELIADKLGMDRKGSHVDGIVSVIELFCYGVHRGTTNE